MRSRKAIYNISSSFVLQLVIILYGFIVPKLIISNFGSSTNGLVSSITQFLSYIALLESGFGPVVKATLYKPIANKDKKAITNILASSEKFFRVISRIFILYIIILGFLYPILVNKEFSFIFSASLIGIISISSFFEYYFGMTYNLFLQSEQKNYISSIIQTVLYAINIALVVVLIKFNASIHIIKLLTGIVFVVRPLLQNYYVKKKYNINLKDADKNYSIKQKWDGLIQHIAYVIHMNTDVTVLTVFSTLTDVSIYSVYYMVVRGIRSIIQSFTNGIDSIFGDMLAKKETENIGDKFSLYESLYFTIVTIIYSCTIVLIVPFISVYTRNVSDANYIRPLFAYLLVISEILLAIRLPSSSITLAAGHFKETKIGACIEAIINITVSIVFVSKYGLIGVVIGTIASILIRTMEFVFHANKYILQRNIIKSLKRILLICIEISITFFLYNRFYTFSGTSYFTWFVNAIAIFIVELIVILAINSMFYYKEYRSIFALTKKMFRNRRGKNV